MEQQLRDVFDLFDTNGDGTVSIAELGAVYKAMGQNITDSELQEMIANVDHNNSGCLDYGEFVTAVEGKIQRDKSAQEIELKEAFRHFDRDGKGSISIHELRVFMRKLGENMSEDELKDMINEADADGDGIVNFKDFTKAMLK